MALLIIPGLGDSGPEHWQTWLQQRAWRAWRVEQPDWHDANLSRWSAAIGRSLRQRRHWRCAAQEPVIAVAHSFGCLALARHLLDGEGIDAAMLVAPAAPRAVGVDDRLVTHALSCPAVVIGSANDQWASIDDTLRLANAWGAGLINLGQVGHLNVASGHGPWPLALRLTQILARRVAAQRRWQQEAMPASTVNFAI
ncbi:MAG: alpha/beta hydrolase [Burkholderiaceae bacterium]